MCIINFFSFQPENCVETTHFSCDSIQIRWCVEHSQKIEKYIDSKCI